MHFSWTGVMVVKPMFVRALVVGSDKSRVEKGFRWVAPSAEDWAESAMTCGSEEGGSPGVQKMKLEG